MRARLRLVQVAKYIVMRRLSYEDLDTFLSDQTRLATVEALGLLGGEATRESDGRWRFMLLAGTFLAQPDDEPNPPSWMLGLRFKAESSVARMSYWDYLDRRTASVAAGKVNGKPSPSLALVLPGNSVPQFLAHVLSTPAASIGIWRIEVFPMKTARFTQPLHKMPAGKIVFTLRLQRRASADYAPDHKAMLEANQALLRAFARSRREGLSAVLTDPISE